jgi:hypothetical protein
MQSLADVLGVPDPKQPDAPAPRDPGKLTAKQFCQAVVNSPEFRAYITNGIFVGDLPAPILLRIMDTAWGKPVERVEVKDRSEALEDLTPEVVAAKLERVQRMLMLLRNAQTEDDDTEHVANSSVH